MTDELHNRFQHLQTSRQGDWGDVLRRAGKRRGRRRLALAAGVAAVLALAAPTALALRSSVVDFFQSEPAPKPVVLDFAQLDVGAPPGMETEVVAGQARKIIERKGYEGQVFKLYAAPSKKGGFCTFLQPTGGGGCLPQTSIPIAPEISIGTFGPDGVIRRGPFVVSGWVGLADAASIELRYEDGATTRQDLTWVSKPVDSGYFLFDVEPAHWKPGHRPEALVAFGENGRVLGTEPLHIVPPPAVSAAEARPQAVQTSIGSGATLRVAPTPNGRMCFWLDLERKSLAASCPDKNSLPPYGVIRSEGGRVALLWGGPLARYVDGRPEPAAADGKRAGPADKLAFWVILPKK